MCTGSSSTAVTPMDLMCWMTSGAVRPRKVPRSSSGTAGWRMVRPRTCASYSTVCSHGVCGGRSSPQVNAGSMTRHFGMNGALSRSS